MTLVYRHDGHLYEAETSECLVCGVHYTEASFDPSIHRLLCDVAKEEARQDAFHPVWRRLARRRKSVGVACRPTPA